MNLHKRHAMIQLSAGTNITEDSTMDLNLGTIIKRLRMEQSVTQEELKKLDDFAKQYNLEIDLNPDDEE